MLNQWQKTAQTLRRGAPASRRQVLLFAGGLALATGWPGFSLAQSDAEINDIIRSLAPIRGQTVTPGYGGESRKPVTVERTTIYVDVRRSVNLEVYFPFASASITPTARKQLAALGRALASPRLAVHRYLVAGHTDAVGSDEYNLDLSRRRAAAVRDYLVSAFPIDPDRLMTVGFGFRQLKRPNAPRAAINRRVEVLLIVP
ncbi:MAG: OmpA family protein [Pseudorhodoplanes sp.]|nr:MAG: OmpA family protein [Pseudorhodoplanes sp.]